MIERGRETTGWQGREGRSLGFWRHSSLCINTTGESPHGPPSLPNLLLRLGSLPTILFALLPDDTKLCYFFFFAVHSTLFIILRAERRRGAKLSSLSYVTTRNEVLACPLSPPSIPSSLARSLRVSQLLCIYSRPCETTSIPLPYERKFLSRGASRFRRCRARGNYLIDDDEYERFT